MRKQKRTRRQTIHGAGKGAPQKCRMDPYNCPFELEEGEIVDHQLVKEIINGWCKQGGCVEEASDGNGYYLHCDSARNSNHHIHIFVNEDAYLYKRNGYRNDAKEKGYGLTSSSIFCLEKGASYKWNAQKWINFLYRRQCQEENEGSCAN